MKHYFFGHGLNPKSKNSADFLEFLNNTEESMTIGLSSLGGEVGFSLFLLDLLNSKKEKIHLVAAGVIYSSAFDLWVGFKGYKSVLAGTMGMTHMADNTVRLSEKGKHMPDDKEIVENSSSFSEITEKITFPVMNPQQIKNYEAGKDVYLTCENLRKIAASQNRKNRAKKPL